MMWGSRVSKLVRRKEVRVGKTLKKEENKTRLGKIRQKFNASGFGKIKESRTPEKDPCLLQKKI